MPDSSSRVASPVLERARELVHREARLLERRLFDHMCDGGSPAAVVEVLRAYRNPDGGFGHALEPDVRTPLSQPLFADVALCAMDDAGVMDPGLVEPLCDWLDRVSGESGGVPCLFRSALDAPHAAHWSGAGEEHPGLNPTAKIVGLLHKHGVRHAWLTRATAFCLDRLEREPLDGAHTVLCVLPLVEHVADERTEAAAKRIVSSVASIKMLKLDPDTPGYGLSPLDFAPDPDGRWRSLFDDATVHAHLDSIERTQEPDGSWPIMWSPPAGAALGEWRGVRAVSNLRILKGYGRL